MKQHKRTSEPFCFLLVLLSRDSSAYEGLLNLLSRILTVTHIYISTVPMVRLSCARCVRTQFKCKISRSTPWILRGILYLGSSTYLLEEPLHAFSCFLMSLYFLQLSANQLVTDKLVQKKAEQLYDHKNCPVTKYNSIIAAYGCEKDNVLEHLIPENWNHLNQLVTPHCWSWAWCDH